MCLRACARRDRMKIDMPLALKTNTVPLPRDAALLKQGWRCAAPYSSLTVGRVPLSTAGRGFGLSASSFPNFLVSLFSNDKEKASFIQYWYIIAIVFSFNSTGSVLLQSTRSLHIESLQRWSLRLGR